MRTRQVIERIRAVNPHAVDFVLAIGITFAALWSVAGGVAQDDEYRDVDFLAVALLLLQTLPIAIRSVAPMWALIVSVTAIVLHIAIGYQGVAFGTFAALIILYSAASLTDTRRALVAAAVAFAGITIFFATDRTDPDLLQALNTYATYGGVWLVGVYVRSRREYTNVVEERAGLLEREREVQAREAVADERARIARELHDIVGHALNLIVIQSGAAQRAFDARPELVRDSLSSIESTGREALNEMERMLGMLRQAEEESGSLSPQPGLDQVGELAAHVTEAGLPVRVMVEGTPAALPPSVDLSAYRIIQEALTNALKHAGQAQACVTIRHAPQRLELEITDDGRGASPGRGHDSGGQRGLIGMRERVALFGGELVAGPRPEGGFRVHATLPLKDGVA